jgi:hypothetical protein
MMEKHVNVKGEYLEKEEEIGDLPHIFFLFKKNEVQVNLEPPLSLLEKL